MNVNNIEFDEESTSPQLDYFDIAQLEGIAPEQLTNTQIRYKNLNVKPSEDFKIPLISHYIWFTNTESPKEVREQDLLSLFKIVPTLDSQGSSWQHFLWTNCKACIPKTIKSLEFFHIQVKEINELRDTLISFDIVNDLIAEKKFGIAADFFRFDLLKNIGGIYFDLNYILHHSPERYMKTFDFFTHTDRGGFFIDVYMIAAKPHHPVLEEATNTVLRNFINPPQYVQQAQNSTMHIQELTGVMTYLPFNFAFFKHVNQNTIDFVFPLEIKDSYPHEAKHPHFFSSFGDEANNHEICMDEILGFDSHDGNSWFDEPALYND